MDSERHEIVIRIQKGEFAWLPVETQDKILAEAIEYEEVGDMLRFVLAWTEWCDMDADERLPIMIHATTCRHQSFDPV